MRYVRIRLRRCLKITEEFSIAESYCAGCNATVSRESNTGFDFRNPWASDSARAGVDRGESARRFGACRLDPGQLGQQRARARNI